MKILVVSQYFWPENFRINDLVKEWVARGHEVTVLTGKPNYPDGQVFPEFAREPERFSRYEGARVHRVPMLARSQGAMRLILNYLSFVIGGCLWGPWLLRGLRADVIFVYEPSPITVGIPAILLGRLKRAPVVLWVLDLWPETLAAVGAVRSPIVLRMVGHLVSFIYNRCALVLGQSRAFIDSIGHYCRDRSKVRYFPSWAESLFLHADGGRAPEVPTATDTFGSLHAGLACLKSWGSKELTVPVLMSEQPLKLGNGAFEEGTLPASTFHILDERWAIEAVRSGLTIKVPRAGGA